MNLYIITVNGMPREIIETNLSLQYVLEYGREHYQNEGGTLHLVAAYGPFGKTTIEKS